MERLAREAARRTADFLVIGGHAVIHHGYVRMTLDIDLLAPEKDRACWREILEKFQYQPYNETPAFSQFASATPGWPQVDIMFVTDSTWSKLWAGAERKTGQRLEVLIPTPRHLVALKLHAANSSTRELPGKDWTDIEQLMRLHHLDPNEVGFADLIREHGGEESLARLKNLWQTLSSTESS